METKEKGTVKKINKPVHLAKASVTVLDDAPGLGLLYMNEVDEMKIPADYQKLIRLCRFFYKHDPIAGCYDDDTDVLTESGWKRFQDVGVEDNIATLDNMGFLVYQKPTALVNKKYTGQMYSVNTRGVDLLVTPDHNVFVAFRDAKTPRSVWKYVRTSARDIYGKHVIFKKNARWVGEVRDTIVIGSRTIPMNEWLAFFGLWLAEGGVSKKPNDYSINIRHSNQTNMDIVRSVVSSWGIRVQDTKDKTSLRFSNRDMHEYLKPMTGAVNKCIPTEIKSLVTNQLSILFDFYTRGDAHIRKSGRVTAYTVSPKLRDDLQELAIKLGFNGASYTSTFNNGSFSKSLGRTIKSNRACYSVNFLKSTIGSRKSEPRHEDIVDYSGGIHCVEVPNHILYVRRNGKCVWCGNTVLNKMTDCAITPLTNRKSECSDEEYAVYNSLLDMLQEFFRNVCLEYLLSGLVVPQYEWTKARGSDLAPDLDSRRRVNVPDNIWFRDPATLTVKNSPINNKKYIYVTIDADTIQFIKSGGKLKDGTKDEETFKQMQESYPDFVAAVKALKGTRMQIRLTAVRPIFSRTLPEDAYPVPYMTNALEALVHKRNLRKMDYSIAARVIAAIQLIKLGSDDFPCTDEADFDQIKNQMNYRTASGNSDRIYQLFANHTLTIEWVFPDTAAMLNREKYSSVEDDIIAGLGFPRTLITGETLRSNVAGGTDFAAFSPIATMETIRDKFLEWTKELYKEIQEKNSFKNRPIPAWSPMKLYKLLDLDTIGMNLYKEGSLSRQTRLEMQGLDLNTEVERKQSEAQQYKDKNIPDAPTLPFSSPSIGNNPKVAKTPVAPKKTPVVKDKNAEGDNPNGNLAYSDEVEE